MWTLVMVLNIAWTAAADPK